jgi:hypothetical protein
MIILIILWFLVELIIQLPALIIFGLAGFVAKDPERVDNALDFCLRFRLTWLFSLIVWVLIFRAI